MTSTPRVWFLTGSQGLYGPETVAQVEQQSQQIVDQLNEGDDLALPVEWRPVLTDSESVSTGRHSTGNPRSPPSLSCSTIWRDCCSTWATVSGP